jgi:hypothetical protein
VPEILLPALYTGELMMDHFDLSQEPSLGRDLSENSLRAFGVDSCTARIAFDVLGRIASRAFVALGAFHFPD